MAKVYDAPKEIQIPEFNWEDLDANEKAENKYLADLKQWLTDRCVKGGKSTENVGEVLQFPAADGYACYMVSCMKPLELVHIALGDAWHFQYANRLTVKDVNDKIKSNKAMNELFNKKK